VGNGEISRPYQCWLVFVFDISVHNGSLRVLFVDINLVDTNINAGTGAYLF
jgi:hypothetical protein